MAANMIGVKKNIIVVAAGPFQFAMINPEITQKSGAFHTEEGCLSLEGVRLCTRYKHKVVKIKHALNISNSTSKIYVNGIEMTIDEILVKMSQLNRRKSVLDYMRKQEPKRRISSGAYSSKKTVPEYMFINYDLKLIKSEYERIDSEISSMQLALDKYNQTFEFDLNIDL